MIYDSRVWYMRNILGRLSNVGIVLLAIADLLFISVFGMLSGYGTEICLGLLCGLTGFLAYAMHRNTIVGVAVTVASCPLFCILVHLSLVSIMIATLFGACVYYTCFLFYKKLYMQEGDGHGCREQDKTG